MKFQFTPLREGRQLCKALVMHDGDISIHAPPRGATLRLLQTRGRLQFQFTPLREGRRLFRSKSGRTLGISIHAPPRGAT